MIPIWLYILVMALVTYLIRALPFTLVRKKIRSRFIRSLLYYIPYAVLTAMTLPGIFTSTGSVWSAVFGCAAAVALALWGKSLLIVALGASAGAFLVDLLRLIV